MTEEKSGLWLKIIEVLVTTALISFFGYLISNFNSIQKMVGDLSSDLVVKSEKILVLERELKGKHEFLEFLKEENAVHKEKLNSHENLLNDLQDENRQLKENFQTLKERLILLEAKK